jgi:transketolase
VREAKAVTDKPSLLCCKTVIGFGSPNKANSHDCHGSALGAAEVALVREQLAWPYAPFEIPEEIYAAWDATEKVRNFRVNGMTCLLLMKSNGQNWLQNSRAV